MMRRSLNEIELMARKAAVGAGWAGGLAEDAGRAAAWLCSHGYDGVQAAHASINAGPQELSVEHTQTGVVFQQAQAARAGPSVLDLMADGGVMDHAILRNVDVPIMVLGLAGVLSAQYGTAVGLEFANGTQAHMAPEGHQISGEIVCASCDVKVRRITWSGTNLKPTDAASGYDVNEDIWAKLGDFAANTYVPATEESRWRGAGAGLIDND
jgi:hypothetical protein